ncbi:hypothetical protein D1815_15585 [Aquimarina sp. AD1]|uniref:hypothetical protein n=1 Tax=Aquimarina sp. (strain AD1) TaxID=1714848 RepID=UPI000E5233D5|nr:hypothetical protein [Aquimarina sp. AD1]AXT57098.1 hypothetical protein D1815_15585 [Aquimarina sp. AD1]RKN12367.1 hypothetical protein D7035_18445 [Aquimarina sp. AD1]
MKNLKSLKKSLLSKNQGSRELTTEERKVIRGGYYTSEEECKEDCNGSGGGWGFWSHKDYCVRGSDGYWTCYDS